MCAENSDKPCDTGTPLSTIAAEFPGFSFDTVFPEYPSKRGRWAFSDEAIKIRGEDCRRWLRERTEKVIAVVSHSGFLRVGVSHVNYENGDYRIFEFLDCEGNKLVEWPLTRDNSGGMGWSGKEPISNSVLEGSQDGEVNKRSGFV